MLFANRFALTALAFAVFGGLCFGADDEYLDKSETKKSTFEKRLYYGLEKTDGITQIQKEKILTALKDFQAKKEKINAKNTKRFQSDDIDGATLRQLADGNCESTVGARAALLGTIHGVMNPKQREQFIKRFQGSME
jgi:hypothetical protein